MTPKAEMTLAASADVIALAWAMQRRARYLAGPEASSVLAEVFGPALYLAWVHLALMRVLIP
jgi:hypothetical protein